MTRVTDIHRWITDGQLDDHLISLNESIKIRLRVVRDREARQNMESLKSGDRVRLKNLRPKYLNGRPATVKDNEELPETYKFSNVKPNTIIVQLDVPVRRFGEYIGIPANCLMKES